ncbi:hypothetical protein [Moheibacter sediminis]|uniref:Uncharacterized protein n=1 Tax=Moheibacter sediminis TaxID=1434700 RepID=A0A1W2C7V4_9FLAO|nr:hypothetical protein [Moheibacter sediminis]SMC81220.1 hypothetical protein SAMN06296427_10940 [Moheibacter sediminis]
MKTDILPFPIGMEYENLEFDLEILPDRIKGYDSYIYVGKEVKKFLNHSTDKIELIFYCDEFLQAVVIFLDEIDPNLKQELLKYFELVEETDNLSTYQNEEIQLYTLKESRAIVYGNPDVISLVLSTLLC